jgi:hypothetical protein
MKTFTKYLLFCGAAFVLWACELDSTSPIIDEIPIMDSRVVSYQGESYYQVHWSEQLKSRGIIDNIDTLKSWFPHDLNEQNECNYFAIYNSTNSTGSGYLVLTNDMVLHSLKPSSRKGCAETTDIFYEIMLVCDDKANTLKNNINLNGSSYAVLSWNCNKGKTAPKKGFFPNHPPPVMPKPVMDSRVVSYQNVENKSHKIVTNTDTLKLWFPHIFGNGQAKPECNYFAMTFEHRNTYYEPAIFSNDNKYSEYVLYDVRPGGAYGENCKSVIKNEGLVGAMLICDDDAFTLKNIIKPYDTPYYYISPGTYLDPNWDCESGVGAPTIDEIFF